MKFADIPQLTQRPGYSVMQDWKNIERTLDYYKEHYGLDLDPDFQRGHVWTEAQQIAYVEFCLRGGESANQIYFNCPYWQGNKHVKEMVLVDGKQRLTAVLKFINNEITAFGALYREYEDRLPTLRGACFITHINDLPNKEAVLRWYLEMNSGGTPHTDEELKRVQELLDKTAKEKGTVTT